MVLSPREKILCSYEKGPRIYLWNLEDTSKMFEIKKKDYKVQDVKFSETEPILYVFSKHTLDVWDLQLRTTKKSINIAGKYNLVPLRNQNLFAKFLGRTFQIKTIKLFKTYHVMEPYGGTPFTAEALNSFRKNFKRDDRVFSYQSPYAKGKYISYFLRELGMIRTLNLFSCKMAQTFNLFTIKKMNKGVDKIRDFFVSDDRQFVVLRLISSIKIFVIRPGVQNKIFNFSNNNVQSQIKLSKKFTDFKLSRGIIRDDLLPLQPTQSKVNRVIFQRDLIQVMKIKINIFFNRYNNNSIRFIKFDSRKCFFIAKRNNCRLMKWDLTGFKIFGKRNCLTQTPPMRVYKIKNLVQMKRDDRLFNAVSDYLCSTDPEVFGYERCIKLLLYYFYII